MVTISKEHKRQYNTTSITPFRNGFREHIKVEQNFILFNYERFVCFDQNDVKALNDQVIRTLTSGNVMTRTYSSFFHGLSLEMFFHIKVSSLFIFRCCNENFSSYSTIGVISFWSCKMIKSIFIYSCEMIEIRQCLHHQWWPNYLKWSQTKFKKNSLIKLHVIESMILKLNHKHLFYD